MARLGAADRDKHQILGEEAQASKFLHGIASARPAADKYFVSTGRELRVIEREGGGLEAGFAQPIFTREQAFHVTVQLYSGGAVPLP